MKIPYSIYIAITAVAIGTAGFSARTIYAASAAKTGSQELILQSHNNEEVMVLPAATSNTWRGSYVVSHTSPLFLAHYSLYELVASYLGDRPISSSYSPNYAQYSYDPGAVYDWVENLAGTINNQPQAPVLEIENKRAVNFQPPKVGQTLNVYETTRNILTALETQNPRASLAISKTLAPATELSGTNSLGIQELLAEGISNFSGSPKNRIHNIHVGVEKMRGVIIAPGDEFSFNKYLGPVEAAEGFLPELVIKANETIPELGGGLCQVSTTTFRAAVKAGLPITARRNHAYAVKYYAPQGTDATIYPGVQDLKFTNDTPASILIWPYFKDTYTLVFAFYGTKDDRQITINDPVQFDRQANGAMKATWKRLVIKDGVTNTAVFKSTYQPPALFHKQEQFVPATPEGDAPSQPNSTPAPPPAPANSTPSAPNNSAPTNTGNANSSQI